MSYCTPIPPDAQSDGQGFGELGAFREAQREHLLEQFAMQLQCLLSHRQ
jgi:hypothetical protein